VTIRNLTTGDNTHFRVGDQWAINASGCTPNAAVYLNILLNQWPMPMSGQQDLALSAWTGTYQDGNRPIGQTDANGNYSASGTFGAGQVGTWHIVVNLGGQLGSLPTFTVADQNGIVPPINTPPPAIGGSPYYLLASNQAPAQQYTAAQLTALATPPVVTPAIAPQPQQSAGPGGQLTFQNLSSGNPLVLRVGDNWKVTIAGASPNAAVAVTGGLNGQSSTTPMGSTDASGGFTKSGTITADEVGAWQEHWTVGGVSSGFFAFTVPAPGAVTAPAGGAPAPSPGAVAPAAGGRPAAAGSGIFDVGSFLTESVFMGVPNWILLLGLGGVFLWMSGGHHRG
jgi:hypothetical protein